MKPRSPIHSRTPKQRRDKLAGVAALREGKAALRALYPGIGGILDRRFDRDDAPRTARPRLLAIDAPGYREWCKAHLGCMFAGPHTGPLDFHHVPTRGALGIRCDLFGTVACRACHRRCDMAESHGGISKGEQALAVLATMRRAFEAGVLHA